MVTEGEFNVSKREANQGSRKKNNEKQKQKHQRFDKPFYYISVKQKHSLNNIV